MDKHKEPERQMDRQWWDHKGQHHGKPFPCHVAWIQWNGRHPRWGQCKVYTEGWWWTVCPGCSARTLPGDQNG